MICGIAMMLTVPSKSCTRYGEVVRLREPVPFVFATDNVSAPEVEKDRHPPGMNPDRAGMKRQGTGILKIAAVFLERLR